LTPKQCIYITVKLEASFAFTKIGACGLSQSSFRGHIYEAHGQLSLSRMY